MAAIKSVYLANALHPMWPELCEEGHGRHYAAIATANGFDLPNPDAVAENNREMIGRRAASDHHYCTRQLMNAGLYFDLLD